MQLCLSTCASGDVTPVDEASFLYVDLPGERGREIEKLYMTCSWFTWSSSSPNTTGLDWTVNTVDLYYTSRLAPLCKSSVLHLIIVTYAINFDGIIVDKCMF